MLKKRKRVILAVLAAGLLAAYLGRVLYLRWQFTSAYREVYPKIGETFEEDGLEFTVTGAEREKKEDDSFGVLVYLTIANPTEEDRTYDLASVYLTGLWFSCSIDGERFSEINEGSPKVNRNFLVEANTEHEWILPFLIMKYYFAEETWEKAEETDLSLSFIQTTDRKLVEIP